MENENQINYDDANSLKVEIELNEVIIDKYLKTAQNMKMIGIPTVLLAVFLFMKSGMLLGFTCLFMAFLCLRKYNQSIGMAEVYYGVTKFLKMMYQREVTGDKSVPLFLQ